MWSCSVSFRWSESGSVEQGRAIHANIRKTLRFLLSTNFSEILVTLGGLTLGLGRPLSAIQFLWINLLSDVGPALALEAPEADLMAQPPRDPAEPILSRRVLGEIGGDAAVLSAATLGVHALALARYGAGPQAATLAFSTLTSAQLIHALRCRSAARAGFSALAANPLLAGVVGGSLALQLAATTASPLRRLLGTTALSAADLALVAGGAVVPAVIGELQRAFARPAAV
ncbi:MAG: cation transporting ATPase C-terminal domain-containing protein [bacterium]